MPGIYTVNLLVTNQDGCTANQSRQVTVTANTTTGVGNVNNSIFNIYSNRNTVYVDFTATPGVNAAITIYNILGQQLSSYKTTTAGLFEANVDAITEGYIVIVIREENKITTKKLFVTNNY